MRKNWPLGFLGFLFLMGIPGVLEKDWHVLWFVWIIWFAFFIPNKKITTPTNKKPINGYIMTIIGFVIILFNALCYIFNWDYKSSPLVIIGIVFIGIGTNMIKKCKKEAA